MGGFLRYLGFALPFSILLDRGTTPPRDAKPSRGRCSLCKRFKDETYSFGVGDRICRDDLADTVRVSTYRVTPQRRTIDSEKPKEIVAEREADLVRLDPWWDSQLP